MTQQLVVAKGRTVTVTVSVPYDVSDSTFVSEIREDKASESPLIATWTVSFLTDGADGELVLTLDDSLTKEILHTRGFMDVKRIANGEPTNLWDEPLEVIFRNSVTV